MQSQTLPLNSDIALKAIAIIETGDDYTKVGQAGELTEYQILPRNIPAGYDISTSSGRRSLALQIFRANAVRIYQRNANAHNDIRIHYAVWNMGYSGVRARKFRFANLPPVVQGRCNRYRNLYYALYPR